MTVGGGGIPFILASGSPRRTMLLEMVGITHSVVVPTLEEDCIECDEPAKRVMLLAREKVTTVRPGVDSGIILGADTLVVREGIILEKPGDREEARGMLRTLADSWHDVYTGVCVVDVDQGLEASDYEVTRVRFRSMDSREIEAYLDTGEPMDKAGSYGIQGHGAVFIERIEGCYFNVVGLPLRTLVRLLGEIGCEFDFKRLRRRKL